MKNYLNYFLIKVVLWFLNLLPLKASLALGRFLGFLAWASLSKQKKTAYKNLRAAFYNRKSNKDIKSIIWSLYQNLGMTIAEIARFPRINKEYIKKYIEIKNFDCALKEKDKNKGIIFLTAHLGNWEFSSQIASIMGCSTKVLARQQKNDLFDEIINRYRNLNGCQVITKGANLKVALRALNNKDNLGLLADESAKDGDYVSFFGRNVPAPAGPMAISYKTESPVIISLLVRKKGPYHRLTMDEPFYVKEKAEIHKYLQIYYDKLSQIIDKYPDQWLWVQKRWRLSRERNIVVFSDNKAGHFNQSIAVASWLKEELNKKGYRISLPYEDEEEIKTIQPVYKHKSCPVFLNIALRSKIYKLFAEKILAFCLTKESFDEIINIPADYIISCGNSLSALSAILKYINLCKNIVIMKPTISLAHYDLAVIPAHDSARRGKNIVITKAAPNLIDRLLCKGESSELKNKLSSKKTLSLFFGGDTQSFKYEDSFVSSLVLNLKKITEANDLNLLITTSRRTSKANEELFKKDLKAYNKCNLLIIANEKNPVNSAVAMLAASDLVLVTFDSISMISEAASSRAKVIVVLPDVLEKIKGFPKHKKLIKNFLESNLIDIATLDVLKETIEKNIASDNKSEILTEEKKVKESFSGIL